MRRHTLVLIVLMCTAAGAAAQTPAEPNVARELDEVARVATAMVDGDECLRIMTPRALGFMFEADPKDPSAAGDNFDVRHEPYIRTKKTLIRLSRLVPYTCDVNLWMPFEETPDKVQVVIRNVNELSQFWSWGLLMQDMPPEMRRVLQTGKRETVQKKPAMISVLAPVYNSLGRIVALVEVVAVEPNAAAPPVNP